MELKYYSVSNLYKQGLVTPVIVLFIICKGERYCVGGFGIGDIGVGQSSD